jgi:hypothetical protein
MDALTYAGPANPACVKQNAVAFCSHPVMPGVKDPTAARVALVALGPLVSVPLPLINLAGLPQLKAEPPLKCYVYPRGC